MTENQVLYPQEHTPATSSERLLNAVIDLWAGDGNGGASARAISRVSGLPTSTIYHHFGSLEHLFLRAHDHARLAAKSWMDSKITELTGWPANDDGSAIGTVLSGLVDEWATAQRRLALASQQCHLHAVRDAAYLPLIWGWREIWGEFWQQLCTYAGRPGMAEYTQWFFDGASMVHLIRWRRAVDRAAVDELCHGWGRWLSGTLAGPSPWRDYARDQALLLNATAPVHQPPRHKDADAIALAAARLVQKSGLEALTHRAVAAEAGVTLGLVSYNFRTGGDLARGAFDAIYNEVTQPSKGSIWSTRATGLMALDELFIAVARDPKLADFALQLRYLRGQSSGKRLSELLNGRPVSATDAAIYSSMLSGVGRAMVGRTTQERQAIERTASAVDVFFGKQ